MTTWAEYKEKALKDSDLKREYEILTVRRKQLLPPRLDASANSLLASDRHLPGYRVILAAVSVSIKGNKVSYQFFA